MSITETSPNISWRTYQRLTTSRAAAYNDAKYTHHEARSHRQERVLFDIRALDAKRSARVQNVNIAKGKVHTSSGEHYRGGR